MCLHLFAQKKNDKQLQKAQDAYDAAMLQLRDGLVRDAVPLLGKAIEYNPAFTDAYLSLAGVYGEMKDYAKAVGYFRKAQAIDSAYAKYYLLPCSINLAALGKFNEALAAVDSFLMIKNLGEKSIKAGNYRKECYQFAIDYAAKHPNTNYVFAPQNLGDSINSKQSEYYPSFTIDDSTFVFTRRGEGIREDFIESTKTKDGYTASQAINGDINIEPSKGAINISQDGEWLLFAGNFSGKGFGNFDIYQSYNTPKGWSEPFNLGTNINTEFWESGPSLSPDKNALYFSSDRPGGYGGKDLYVSYRQSNGKWGAAQNMGPSVNTAGDELAPFIHADNQTLYYTSNGLPGYGGTDIYMLRKNGIQWSAPENLGFPINTVDNEGSLFVASDGVTAYYASDRADSRGGLDLYKFELDKAIQPAKTLYVKGYVTDAATGKGLPSAVELTDDSNEQVINKVQTDGTGFYFITLPVGKDYTFTVNRKGYLFYSDVFPLSKKQPDSTYQKDIQLQPLQLNAAVTFKNIQFQTNSYQLEPVSMIELNKLLQLMTENPTIKVQVNGHTDNVGTPAANLNLSTNRAKAVVDYLISKGIDAKRLQYKGFGETKPIADNNSEEGKAKNRRTEFVITGL
ncbi:flagellar motor protein MotB [Ilyomonas limi]|uniref:Flagellar motor protein MotB n=1 Tax=Ilyomonas limi TaxID=2575867 RepID=A0A4U3L7U1_9BACT|nr:OmpA family protein [Ilyomonas limi]TKK69926.1 flagellar motor protein MotB [Ilyomonas limi]